MKKILIIEDHEAILIGLEDNLKHEGYEVITARDGKTGLDLALHMPVNLLILDLMLPGMDGYSVCKELKDRNLEIPIIMLTAKGKERDKIHGLELGADDYVTKPFSIKELLARVKAVLRRYEKTGLPEKEKIAMYIFGDVTLDLRKYEAYKGKKALKLTKLEFDIIEYLIRHKGEVISRDQLLNEIWGYDVFPATRTVDNFVVRIRKAIEDDPRNPKYIMSIRSVGYKFNG